MSDPDCRRPAHAGGVGAIVDSRYKRRGGKGPGKQHKILFLAASLLVVTLFIAFGFLGNVLALGFLLLEGAISLFALWELGPWRVRRNNPPSLL